MSKLIPSQTDQPIARLRDELDELFNRFLSRWPAPFDTEFGLGALWGFAVEDRGNEFFVRAEVPGFETNELDVQLSDRLLTIKATKKAADKKGNRRGENSRTYYRSVTLPEGVKAEKVEAKYHNGVLEIRLPKSQAAQPKRIPVKT
jgi:HSP20 family protein